MGSKKRSSSSVEELGMPVDAVKKSRQDKSSEEKTDVVSPSTTPQSLKPMERRKKRKAVDKQKHQTDPKSTQLLEAKDSSERGALAQTTLPSSSVNVPSFHINVFRDLSSPDSSVRESAVEALVIELREVQKAYERFGDKGADKGVVMMEAEKDDGLENCAPSLRYAIRRLIRGVSSSRECARQGFALGLTTIVETIPSIKIYSLMKLIIDLLEVSSSMKGQEARDCLLGRLFAYAALARSGRITAEWISDNKTESVKDFISHVISIANKKRYLREPAVSVILDLVEKLPLEVLLSQVLKAPGMHEWFLKATNIGDPDILFLALKLQERVPMETEMFGKLLPYPFSPENLFTRDRLLYLAPCFKETTFCLPRVHSVWPLLVNILVPDMASQDLDAARSNSGKKHKKSRKGNSSEEIAKNIRCFCEVVIEESLLLSSHDRKHLAFSVLLLLLPRLPASCIQVVLSHKLVLCLMDILSTKGSWLYNAAQHFLKELSNSVGGDDDRRVAVLISLQKHSNGRFDCITRTQVVKELVAKFHTEPGCMLFVHNLMSLFVDEGSLTDEPSDQSQTTDENSEMGSAEDKDSPGTSGNMDFLKTWVIDTLPRKNLKLDSNAKTWAQTDLMKFFEAKFQVQTEIMKFLAVQGLFSASLGTEVTSFELQEKFKWPKAAISSSLCRMCIEQLQLLLEDAQRGEGSHVVPNILELNDLGSYFMGFLNTLCNIPSVSLYRTLSNEDDMAFKKLQAMESRLCQEERNIGPGLDASKLHVLRYLLIQLLLQVLLRPGEFSEAALELVICCRKVFPAIAHVDSEEEDEFDDNDMPELMDVLVDTLLSLFPQSSAPMCFAVEQVFRFFCDDITDAGLLRMLRVVKKDLKPARHQAASSDDDEEDEEDFLGIEDAEEADEAETGETGESDDRADDSEGMLGVETADGEVTKNDEGPSASDDSDGGMDDDAMFQMDSYLARLFKERKNLSGNDTAHSQLMLFKLRVLSLLEIYLQRNPGKPQVLMVYSYLAQAFVNSYTAEGSEQLGQRIGGILQKKIFRAKDYPKGNDIQLTDLETLLEKSLKSASRTRHKMVSSLAQNSAFWILKIIHSRNSSETELDRVFEIFRHVLVDFLDNKKCRLKSGFLKEVIRRHPWVGLQLFGFLLEKCGSVKSEFRRIETLDLVDCITKTWIPANKEERDKDASSKSKLMKGHLPALCELIQELLNKLPEKQSRRAEVRRFCARVLHAISMLKLNKLFLKMLKPDAYSACEAQLGDLFIPFKTPTR